MCFCFYTGREPRLRGGGEEKRKMHFLSFLVRDDRLKLWPGALLWRWLLSIRLLPHPGPWNVSLDFLGASRPPRTLIHTRVCIRRGSCLAIVCCYFIIHLPFSCFSAEYVGGGWLIQRHILFIVWWILHQKEYSHLVSHTHDMKTHSCFPQYLFFVK